MTKTNLFIKNHWMRKPRDLVEETNQQVEIVAWHHY